jgi:hypothetical protein
MMIRSGGGGGGGGSTNRKREQMQICHQFEERVDNITSACPILA